MLNSTQSAGSSELDQVVAESTRATIAAANSSPQLARSFGRAQRVSSTSVAALLSFAISSTDPAEAFGRWDWSASGVIDHRPLLPVAVVDLQADLDERNAGLSAEIAAYRNLKDGWDGPDSIAPTDRAISDALAMIDKLPQGARLPDAMISGDGEVGFYWRTENGYIDIGFKGNGKIAYYAQTPGGVVKGVDDFSPKHRLARNLAKAIETI